MRRVMASPERRKIGHGGGEDGVSNGRRVRAAPTPDARRPVNRRSRPRRGSAEAMALRAKRATGRAERPGRGAQCDRRYARCVSASSRVAVRAKARKTPDATTRWAAVGTRGPAIESARPWRRHAPMLNIAWKREMAGVPSISPVATAWRSGRRSLAAAIGAVEEKRGESVAVFVGQRMASSERQNPAAGSGRSGGCRGAPPARRNRDGGDGADGGPQEGGPARIAQGAARIHAGDGATPRWRPPGPCTSKQA